MDSETRVRAFQALLHATNLDLSALRAALAAGATFQSVLPAMPLRRGVDAICAELVDRNALYDECDSDIREVATNGTTVFMESIDTARIIADGQRTTTHVVAVFDLDDKGRIWFWREYRDILNCRTRLGMHGASMPQNLCAELSGLAR